MDDASANRPPSFARIVCGVDGTSASLVAVRQARRLQDDGGVLFLTSVVQLAKAAQAGMAATHAAQLLEEEAEAALEQARALAPSATSKIVDGDPATVLLREAEAEHATLLVAGSHGRGRVAGLVLGTVAARLLRDATCSVLIARTPRVPETWPHSIIVGVDGSVESAAAHAVGRSLIKRFGGNLRTVASTRDQLDPEAARAIAPDLEEQDGRAVDILASASESADLVVVGSRGLHGLKALGSVSERIAHQSNASVLVVRPVRGAEAPSA